jgi:penicillin-binding protein 2
MRLSVIGVIVIALFSALFVRLWFLQVAEGGELAAAASDNRERIVYEPATRGRILDAQGRPLVDNTIVAALTFDRTADLTTKERRDLVQHVAEVVSPTPAEIPAVKADIEERIADLTLSPYQPVPIVLDVPTAKVQYVAERPEEFPAVDVTQLTVRSYPHGTLAAHVLGYVGEINAEELELHPDGGYREGDLIGKTGVEQMFETELRGDPRVVRLEVDNTGQVEPGGRTVLSEGRAGNDVQLTIDIDQQRIAEVSLAQGMDGARAYRDVDDETQTTFYEAPGGTVITLDAQTGSVVAMASAPTFDPALLGQGITAEEFEALTSEDQHKPLLNRAVSELYAPGSTWKPLSALAGLESGVIAPETPVYDEGCTDIAGLELCNAGKKPHGVVDMSRALAVSSDVYFYQLGKNMWNQYCVWTTQCELTDGEVEEERDADRAVGYAIQDTARKYGFGTATGLGLPSEASGRIPDQAWKAEFNESNPDPESQEQNSLWFPGDSAGLAIGQGDLLVTPLQLAVAYMAIADGGRLYTPRLASAIREPGTGQAELGDVITELEPQPGARTRLDDANRAVIMAGLDGAVFGAEGTANAAFSGFEPGSVCGKTGTSQIEGQQDTSLFVGVTDCSGTPRYVVLSIVEHGGFGSDVSAPIVRRVMEGLGGNLEPPAVVVHPGGGTED